MVFALAATDDEKTQLFVGFYLVKATLLVGLVGMIALIAQCWAEYRRRTYDPSWVVSFDRNFNSQEMKKVRSRAASFLKNNSNQLRSDDVSSGDLDDVLDFIEDLGFYVVGDQMTPEVAHHAFHTWVRGYYAAARDYIESVQEHSPTMWEHINSLLEMLDQVEKERAHGKYKKTMNQNELDSFLGGEVKLEDEIENA